MYTHNARFTQHNAYYRTNAHINLRGLVSYTYDISKSVETISAIQMQYKSNTIYCVFLKIDYI